MGIQTSAYLIYGVQIPTTHGGDLEEALAGRTVGVGFLNAGPYDREKTYLTTAFHTADLGSPATIDLDVLHDDGNPLGRWDSMLNHAVEVVGRGQLTRPGWLLIAGQS